MPYPVAFRRVAFPPSRLFTPAQRTYGLTYDGVTTNVVTDHVRGAPVTYPLTIGAVARFNANPTNTTSQKLFHAGRVDSINGFSGYAFAISTAVGMVPEVWNNGTDHGFQVPGSVVPTNAWVFVGWSASSATSHRFVCWNYETQSLVFETTLTTDFGTITAPAQNCQVGCEGDNPGAYSGQLDGLLQWVAVYPTSRIGDTLADWLALVRRGPRGIGIPPSLLYEAAQAQGTRLFEPLTGNHATLLTLRSEPRLVVPPYPRLPRRRRSAIVAGGVSLDVQPAQMRWQAVMPQRTTRVSLTPGQVMWKAQTIGAGKVTIVPSRVSWRAHSVAPTQGASSKGRPNDALTYVIGETLTTYLQTINPDTGAAWDADTLPSYRIYEDLTGTPIASGAYAFLDAVGTDGFYVAQVPLLTATGFEPGKTYALWTAFTIVGATEAQLVTFRLTQNLLTITPARMQWQAQTTARGRTLQVQPARLQWVTAVGIRSSQLTLTPARWRWQAGTPRTAPRLVVLPAQVAWQAPSQTLRYPIPFHEDTLSPAFLAALHAPVLIGDWLVQSQRLQLRLSTSYNPDGLWEHRLVSIGDVEITVAPGGGMATVANVTLIVAEDGTGQSMLQRWRRYTTIGGTADITIDFRLEADGSLCRIFTGAIDTIVIANGQSQVQCVDTSIQRNLQLPQRLVTSNGFALAASGALTQPLPLLYGQGSYLGAAPLLFTNTADLGYTAAGHSMSMTSQIAVYNPTAQLFMPAMLSTVANDQQATIFLQAPLQQQILNTQTGALAVFAQQAVTFASAAIDGSPATLARVNTTALAPNLDGQGLLAIIATPTATQRGNNEAVVTLTNHRRGITSDPTVTGQFTINTINMATGTVLRSAIFTTQSFRHALHPQTTIQTITNLALGDHEAVEVLLTARNEGGIGTASNFYEIQDISIQTGYQPPGDTVPVFLYQDFNGRRDTTGLVAANGIGSLYTWPNDVIGSLLLDEMGLPLSPNMANAQPFYVARTYQFNGGVGYGWAVTRANARDVLHQAAQQAMAILAPDLHGLWGMRPFDPTATAHDDFDASSMLRVAGSAPGTDSFAVTLGNMASVHCRCEVQYAWNPGSQKYDQLAYADETGTNVPSDATGDVRSMCQLSAMRYGVTEPLIVNASWIRDATTARLLLRHLVAYFAFQRLFVTFDTTLQAMGAQLGEVNTVTHPLLPEADSGGLFETHTLRISPGTGRVTITASKRAALILEYCTLKDQTGVVWYFWRDEAGQLTRDTLPPAVVPFTSTDITGTVPVPSWHQVQDVAGTRWFLFPDVLGQLNIDSSPPALGTGVATGLGFVLTALNTTQYRLGVSGEQAITSEDMPA